MSSKKSPASRRSRTSCASRGIASRSEGKGHKRHGNGPSLVNVPFVVPLGLIEETRRGSGSDLGFEFFNFQRDLVFLIHPFGIHTFPFQHSRALVVTSR